MRIKIKHVADNSWQLLTKYFTGTVVKKDMMRYFLLIFSLFFCLFSCSEDEENIYSGKQKEYTLHQANPEYAYEGAVTFKELKAGGLEITLQLLGERGQEPYFFPAHLHHGAYDTPNAPMAAMLNPVDIRTLKSVTVVHATAQGEILNFDALESFNGHVKVHLAEDGPDYQVILVAGNIGSNADSQLMDMGKITLCAPI